MKKLLTQSMSILIVVLLVTQSVGLNLSRAEGISYFSSEEGTESFASTDESNNQPMPSLTTPVESPLPCDSKSKPRGSYDPVSKQALHSTASSQSKAMPTADLSQDKAMTIDGDQVPKTGSGYSPINIFTLASNYAAE